MSERDATTAATAATTAATRLITPTGRLAVASDRLARRLMVTLSRAGVSVLGSRILAVRGRTSGEWRTNPVNVLTLDGDRYLVAPRGNTQWVRNLRAAGTGELRHGRGAEAFRAEEVTDAAAKLPVLRHYLDRWGWEVGAFFEGLSKKSPDADVLRIAPGFPVFRILPA